MKKCCELSCFARRKWKKFTRIMKLTMTLLFVAILTATAGSTYSQSARINLKMKDASLVDVFREIERTSEFGFFFKSEELDLNKHVSIDLKDATIDEILEKILIDNYSYRILDKNIIVTHNISNNLDQQQKSISGKVTDSSGGSLPGVSVVVKGTTTGVITDGDGKYSLTKIPDNATLVFSFVGMKGQEIAVGGKTIINVKMEEETVGIEEVVAVGYGTMKKSDLTGAVSSIRSEAINDMAVQTVGQTLRGRASGVKVTNQSGAPGGNSIIQIRGANSVMGGNDPLIIVDGFPLTGGLDAFDPNDIESVEILKDASSTSIYGARASNGVIIVATKKGKSGMMKIDFDSYYGTQTASRLLEFSNAQEFMTLANARAANDGEANPFFPNPSAITSDTNWQKEIFRTAPIQNHNITLSGGNEKLKFSLSGGYFDQVGIVKSTDYSRFTLRSNIDAVMNKWLSINNSLLIARSTKNLINTGSDNDPITSALKAPPTLPVYDQTGGYSVLNIYKFSDGVVENPVAQLNEMTNIDTDTRIFDNMGATITIMPGLTFKSTLGVDFTTHLNDSYASRKVQAGKPSGRASKSNSEYYSILNENTLNFNKEFGKNRLDAVAGYTWQKYRIVNFTAGSNNFVSDDLLYNVLGSGSEVVPPVSGGSEWGIASWLGRMNYNFDSKYFVTFSGRADGASRFAEGNKWAFFPSAALGWRASEENWMKQFSQVSNLKLRASIGQTGNQAIDPYQTMQRMSSIQLALGDALNIGYAPANIANKDLKWETTTQIDGGLDLGLFDEKLRFTLDYYYKKTTDLLAQVNLPMSAGFTSTVQNIGSMSNSGFEFSVDAKPITGVFSWDIGFNIYTNKNKILKLAKGADIYAPGPGGLLPSMHILREGQPISMFYGYVQDGMDANGFIKYKNLDDNPVINDLDRQIIGNPHPDFNAGLNNTFSYKNFEFTIFLESSYGFDILNATRYEYANSFYKGQNQIREVYLDYWRPDNTTAKYPKPSVKNVFKPSDLYVEDGSYLKVRHVNLSYSIPVKNLNWIRSAQMYFSGENLFTFTKYSGYDPEVSLYSSGDLRLNVDNRSYPQTRTFTFGVKLGF